MTLQAKPAARKNKKLSIYKKAARIRQPFLFLWYARNNKFIKSA